MSQGPGPGPVIVKRSSETPSAAMLTIALSEEAAIVGGALMIAARLGVEYSFRPGLVMSTSSL